MKGKSTPNIGDMSCDAGAERPVLSKFQMAREIVRFAERFNEMSHARRHSTATTRLNNPSSC
jgi:hypothetical protein